MGGCSNPILKLKALSQDRHSHFRPEASRWAPTPPHQQEWNGVKRKLESEGIKYRNTLAQINRQVNETSLSDRRPLKKENTPGAIRKGGASRR